MDAPMDGQKLQAMLERERERERENCEIKLRLKETRPRVIYCIHVSSVYMCMEEVDQ